MIELLANQAASDAAFERWAAAMVDEGVPHGYGWLIEDQGLVFSNYSHGSPGTITDQVMLGDDPDFGAGIVKIVRPDPSRADRGKLTVVGRNAQGDLFLLREGWLRKNRLSREIRNDFAALSEIEPTPLFVAGRRSPRQWFIVAELGAGTDTIVKQTADFTLACAQARMRAGGGTAPLAEQHPYSLGLDEKGRIIRVRRRGGSAEIVALQGYVWKALKRRVGKKLIKPKRDGYCADGVIREARLLIEIKTGISPHDLYEAVGQLRLYPSLLNLETGLKPILLIPDMPVLQHKLIAALSRAQIAYYTYSVGRLGKKPIIRFTDAFLKRCQQESP